MNCADAAERLSAALDGELGAEEALDVRRHVETCDACARRQRSLEQVRALLRSTPAALVDSSGFDARVLARVRTDRAPAAHWVTGSWLAKAAAVVIAVGSAVLLIRDYAAPPDAGTPAPPAVSVTMPVLPPVENRPGWNEGRVVAAADCGLAGAGPCSIEASALALGPGL
jgi:anti-sigma factor RsiW